jgi:hypothetical protein
VHHTTYFFNMQHFYRRIAQRSGEAAVLRTNNISLAQVMLAIVAGVAIVGCTTGVYTLVYSQPHAEQLFNHTMSINSLFSLVQAASQFVLNDTSVVPGTYVHTTLAVDQKGRLTFAANGTDYGANVTLINSRVDAIASDVQQLISNAVTGTVEQINTGTGLIGGPITSTGTIALANTAVAPGSYTHASLTVDAQGRLTSASSGPDYGGIIGMIENTLASLNMTIVDANGVNASLAPLIMDIETLKMFNATVRQVDTGTGLTGGPITTTGTISLANTAVTPGTYSYASLTVDAQGRLTSAASGTDFFQCY